MLRITKLASGTRIVLLLEGHIRHQWVRELERQVDACRSSRESVALDLRGVNFVSMSGIELLRRLKSEGVSMIRCPAILRDLMD